MARIFRWIGILLIALVVIAAIGAGVVAVASNRAIQGSPLAVQPTALGHGSVDRGKHLYTAVSSCIICHGADGGGQLFVSEPAMMVLYAPNLTRGAGGVGTAYKDADYDRAIRRGMRPDGTRLIIMPAWSYAAMSDDDAASVIAYLRSLPPVDRTTPRVALGPVGRVLIATNKFPLDATRIAAEGPLPSPPPPMQPVAYGGYLARIGGCMGCHGAHLSGGHLAGSSDDPPAANLTPTGIGTWSAVDFMRTLTTGKDPSGHQLNAFMPVATIRNMTDDELTAIYEYLKTVPPRPTGNG